MKDTKIYTVVYIDKNEFHHYRETCVSFKTALSSYNWIKADLNPGEIVLIINENTRKINFIFKYPEPKKEPKKTIEEVLNQMEIDAGKLKARSNGQSKTSINEIKRIIQDLREKKKTIFMTCNAVYWFFAKAKYHGAAYMMPIGAGFWSIQI